MEHLIKLEEWPNILPPVLIILGSFLLGLIFETRILSSLLKKASKYPQRIDSIIITSFRGVIILWSILLGFYLSLSLPNLPVYPTLIIIIKKGLAAAFLGSLTLVIARLSVSLLRVYTTGDDGSSPLTSLFEFLTKILIFSVGILIILQSIGIAITPLLTAFGVGGVSIGLALQTTLSNLMSGINIITSKKVRPGDYIRLKTGESGYVRDVELKYTILQEITDNFLVIPNSQLLAGSFSNYNLPDKSLLIPVEINIDYDSDLEQVEAITLAAANEILSQRNKNNNTVNKTSDCLIRYNKFDYYGINLMVFLRVQEEELFEHLTIKHEFLKKVHNSYKEMGIKFSICPPYFINREGELK
jgi:small-conductance mechanosensitive channel